MFWVKTPASVDPETHEVRCLVENIIYRPEDGCDSIVSSSFINNLQKRWYETFKMYKCIRGLQETTVSAFYSGGRFWSSRSPRTSSLMFWQQQQILQHFSQEEKTFPPPPPPPRLPLEQIDRSDRPGPFCLHSDPSLLLPTMAAISWAISLTGVIVLAAADARTLQ